MPRVQVGRDAIYYEMRGRGAPLVLLHGFGETGRALLPLGKALARRYRVITPDLPGYGRSGPQPRAYPVDFYEQDASTMAAFLDALGIGEAAIAGFSDGAEVALWWAILHPAQVRALVGWGVAGALLPDTWPEFEAVAALMDAPRPEWIGWRATLRALYGEAGARAMTTGWAAAARAILARGGDISLARADAIRCPTLLINGADDPINPSHTLAALAARIPQAQTLLVPDTGHAVHVEHPTWFAQTVLAWLIAHAG